jgi:hypothetical protein
LPTFLRKKVIGALIDAIVFPIAKMHTDWKTFRGDNLFKTAYNGQVYSLEKALNTKIIGTNNGIEISESDKLIPTYIYTKPDSEEKATYVYDKNSSLFIHSSGVYKGKGIDFTIHIPENIFNDSKYQVTALTDYFKEGIKTYTLKPK